MVLTVRADECTLGRSDLSPTSPNPAPGLFIDRDNPAPCSGQIIRWRICYYNPRKFSRRDSLQVLLQTWRLNTICGSRISSYYSKLDIPQQPDDFQCVNINVDPTEYINVQQGDYIAVYTFNNSVLPVIANTADGSRVYIFPNSLILPIVLQTLNPGLVHLSNQAIHLSATIGKTWACFFFKVKFKVPILNIFLVYLLIETALPV